MGVCSRNPFQQTSSSSIMPRGPVYLYSTSRAGGRSWMVPHTIVSE
jgi:hypothetical protein